MNDTQPTSPEPRRLSDCCLSGVHIYSGGEGTNHYLCNACKEMTNTHLEETSSPSREELEKQCKQLLDKFHKARGDWSGDPWEEHPYQDASKPWFFEDDTKELADFILAREAGIRAEAEENLLYDLYYAVEHGSLAEKLILEKLKARGATKHLVRPAGGVERLNKQGEKTDAYNRNVSREGELGDLV